MDYLYNGKMQKCLKCDILRKFHFHEYPARNKRHKYAEKSNKNQKNSVESWC